MKSSRTGIIAAGHAETARAGRIILEEGGNAFDAAVGAAFASFISEPSLTSLGGGGFMTAVPSSGTPRVYDFFVQTPRKRKDLSEVDFIKTQINFGTAVQTQYIGRGSVAVPGCVAGLMQIQASLGRLPFEKVLEPAIQLAKKGVVITAYQEYTMSILEPVLMLSENSRAVFGNPGTLYQEGDLMKRSLFAQTMEALIQEGLDLFYKGEIAQAIDKESQEKGGSIFLDDLEQYAVEIRQPVRFDYQGFQLLTNPPPSAGGSLISYGLALWKSLKNPPELALGPSYVQTLSGIMRAIDQFRHEHLQDQLVQASLSPQFLSGDFILKQKARYDWLGNTSQISVLDAQGNAASLTTTLGGASGHTFPGTGIPSNNMLGELDLHPGGMYRWMENQRVSSMMSPSVLIKDGKACLVTGSGGSSRIRTAILQVLIHIIEHGMNLDAAVDHPRLHWENHILNIEPGLIDDSTTFELQGSQITRWEAPNMFFGGVHSVGLDAAGQLVGKADARRDGAVA